MTDEMSDDERREGVSSLLEGVSQNLTLAFTALTLGDMPELEWHIWVVIEHAVASRSILMRGGFSLRELQSGDEVS